MVLNGHAGVKYGIPFPVVGRAAFGTQGIHIPSMVRAIVACGWFGVNAWIGGLALYSIWNMSATPTMMSVVTTVNALIMVIIGGMGTLIGPIFGAAISQVIQQFFYTWFGARWPLVFGLLFIFFLDRKCLAKSNLFKTKINCM